MPFLWEGQIKNILEGLGKDTYTNQHNVIFGFFIHFCGCYVISIRVLYVALPKLSIIV